MDRVPILNTDAEEDHVVMEVYRKKLVDAMRTLRTVADEKTMKTVPVTRIAKSLDWRTKLEVSVHKFVPGFLLGAMGYIGSVVIPVVAVSGLGTLGVGTLVAVGFYGILGGLGLSTGKYVKETLKDRKLDREVRSPESFRAQGYTDAQMEWVARIISIIMQLTKAANLNTQAALRQVYTSLELLGDLPYEVGEFLLTLSTVVEDGTARGGVTGPEIQSILKEATDIKDAAVRLQILWNER